MVGVHSQTEQHAQVFSEKFGMPLFIDLTSIPADCDVYFLGVSDNAISEVSALLNVKGVVVHCSGLLAINVLDPKNHRGVFWPIQSLNKDLYADFSQVPICIEASDEINLRILESLADRITRKARFISTKQRQTLHLSAVMANNFSNHLFVLAKDYLHQHNLNFQDLMPLIQETFRKITIMDPALVQTGPAARNDVNTMLLHEEMLRNNQELLKIYKTMSESIRIKHST